MLTPPGARELAPTWNLHRHTGKTASNRKQMIAAGCVNSMRKLDQGPQFTSGVSLRTDN